MELHNLKELVEKILTSKYETQTLEIKAAKNGCPTRLYDTLSSFSNQNEGGIIIFGLNENDGFSICGVYDVHDLQKKVNEQCKQMEPIVRPLFTVCEFPEGAVVSAEIPGADISDRPVFYRGVGKIKGSYVRVGDSDELMNNYEIYNYETQKKRIRDDARVVESANLNLINKESLSNYLDAVKKERKKLSENIPDSDILELMGITTGGTPSLTCVLLFSLYPQAYFPQLCITAISLPGTKIGDLGAEGERFLDNKRITGTIPEMLDEAVDFVRKNSRTKTIIDKNGKRIDKHEYPLIAVREGILNALVHRDYSIHTENTPVRIEMYRDRMEIINSGALYGSISIDSLGKVRPETRNVILANAMELLKVTENRYSGIPTIRRELQEAGLPEPEFSVTRGEFKLVIYNGVTPSLSQELQADLREEDILNFCITPKSRDELIELVGKSREYTMTKIINPLVAAGKLKLTIPEKPKSSKQKFVKTK